MNKRQETAVVFILLLILIGGGLSNCAKPNAERKTNPTSNILIHGGSIGKVLGCMFAPSDCEDVKKNKAHTPSDVAETSKEMEDNMTKEFEAVDKQQENSK